jgi:uridine kinase
VSRRLAERLSAPVLPLDAYYFDLSHLPPAGRGGHNFDVPEAMDYGLFLRHLTSLREGRAIARPVYDFATHCRTAKTELVEPAPFIVADGLFLLFWEEVRRLFGTTVYVDLDDQSCLERRIFRDVHERGRTPESVILQFAETVRPNADKYVRPSRQFADLVVDGSAPIEKSVDAVSAHVARNRPRDCAAAR